MESSSSGATLGKWLLRIFLGSFLLAIAAPIALAFAVLHVSGDTRVLRNAVIHGDGAKWQKQVEVNVGALPLWLARCVLPFTPAPPEAQQALSAVRSVEVSLHELRESYPDRARIMREADEKMRKRGWDRVVGVLERDTAVAVYAQPESGSGGNLKISVLVLEGKQMVAVSGRAKLEPAFELAMEKANQTFLAKHRRHEPMVAEAHDK
ncbi:MAG TPA: hypothetical protein VI282_15525 [Verrucomicrobiae bacterium]|jgi:hypothetical protein